MVVGPRRRTDADLEALEDRVRADEPALTTANLSVVRMKTDRWRGVVEVHLVGAADQRDAAAAFLAARYGDAVAVRWLGPDRFLEALHPSASWIAESGRLRVFFALDRNGQQRGNAGGGQETDEQIVIALSRLEPVQDSRTVVGGFSACHADLELREPVGARAVIDPSAGVVRPSLADLRSRPERCWPPPAGPGRGAPAGTVASLHMRVSDLEIGPRARGLLSHRGVRRVDDLLRLSAEQVAALPNMNQKTFDEIVDALAARRPALTWWATDSRSPRVLLKRRPSRTPRTEPDALDPSSGVARPDALPVGRRPHQ